MYVLYNEPVLAHLILRKALFRSDAIWTLTRFSFFKWLRRIPLSLDTYALMKSQFWPAEERARMQTARLRTLLSHAASMPFWQRILQERGLDPKKFDCDDFARMPITSRKSYIGIPWQDFTDPKRISRSVAEQTSGSTSVPFRFLHDRSFELRSFAMCERMFRVAGGGTRYTVISLRGRERMGFAFHKYRFFYIRGFNSIRHRYPQLISLIRSLRGDCIIFGFSSSIAEVARIASENGDAVRLRAVLVAGEELAESKRAHIRQTFDAPVFMYYAASELGRLAFECEHGSLHINEESVLLEIVDENGNAVAPGVEGRIIVTVFDNLVMPFIRYDSGDRGIIETQACACGRSLRSMKIRGRQLTLLTFADGKTISMLGVPPVLDRYATIVRQFQIRRISDLEFVFRLVVTEEWESHKDKIHDRLVRALHPGVRISWELVDSIEEGPNGKVPYFIDETRARV